MNSACSSQSDFVQMNRVQVKYESATDEKTKIPKSLLSQQHCKHVAHLLKADR